MFYKVSVFIDQKNTETGKWTRIEKGLESNSGMVAFTASVDEAKELQTNEKNLITSKDGCRLVVHTDPSITEIWSVNIVKVYIDVSQSRESNVARFQWFDQSPCFYFETR